MRFTEIFARLEGKSLPLDTTNMNTEQISARNVLLTNWWDIQKTTTKLYQQKLSGITYNIKKDFFTIPDEDFTYLCSLIKIHQKLEKNTDLNLSSEELNIKQEFLKELGQYCGKDKLSIQKTFNEIYETVGPSVPRLKSISDFNYAMMAAPLLKQPDTQLKGEQLYVEKAENGLRYTLLSSEGTPISDIITTEQLPQLKDVEILPEKITDDLLNQILEIMSERKHIPCHPSSFRAIRILSKKIEKFWEDMIRNIGLFSHTAAAEYGVPQPLSFRTAIEDYTYPPTSYGVVLNSLTSKNNKPSISKFDQLEKPKNEPQPSDINIAENKKEIDEVQGMAALKLKQLDPQDGSENSLTP